MTSGSSRSKLVVIATTFPFENGKSPDGGATAAQDHAFELARQLPQFDVTVLASSAGESEGVVRKSRGRAAITVVRTNHTDPPADNYNLLSTKASSTPEGLAEVLATYVSGSAAIVCHEAHVDPNLARGVAYVVANEGIPATVVVHTPDRVETGSLGVVESLKALAVAGATLVSVSPKGANDLVNQGIVEDASSVPIISAGLSESTYRLAEEPSPFPLSANLLAIVEARLAGQPVEIQNNLSLHIAGTQHGVIEPAELLWARRFAETDLGLIAGHINEGHKVVLNPAARPTYAKGVHVAIEAMQYTVGADDQPVVQWVGDVIPDEQKTPEGLVMKKHMEALASEVEQATNGDASVIFGSLTSDEVVIASNLVADAGGLMVTASRREGRSLAVLGALANGLPVVGSNIEGHSDLIGTWADPREAFGEVDATKARIEAHELGEAMGHRLARGIDPQEAAAAKEQAASFSLTSEVANTIDLLNASAQQVGRAPLSSGARIAGR